MSYGIMPYRVSLSRLRTRFGITVTAKRTKIRKACYILGRNVDQILYKKACASLTTASTDKRRRAIVGNGSFVASATHATYIESRDQQMPRQTQARPTGRNARIA